MFPLLNETLTLSLVNISETIVQRLTQMSLKFDLYFPEDPRTRNLCILRPFSVDSAEENMALPLELRMNSLNFLKSATWPSGYARDI